MEQNKFNPSLENTIENNQIKQNLIDSAIENVNKLIEEKKKSNKKEITPEEIEKASGMKIDDFVELLNGEKVNIVDTNLKKLFETIQLGIKETEGKSEGSVLRRITNNNIFRASFVTLMLFLKFGQTQATGTEKREINKDPVSDKTKTEISAPTNIEPDENIYHLDVKDFNNSLKALPLKINLEKNDQLIKLELGNYFANDLNEVSDESINQIKLAVENMLSQITFENIDKFGEKSITIYAHSNELKTNNWDGSNEKLSEARAIKMIEIIEPIFKNYKNDGLGEKIEKIRNMKIRKEIASFPGYEKGVLPLTEVINPTTNQKYKEAEIVKAKDNNPALYSEMLAKARGVELIMKAPLESEIKAMNPKGVVFEQTQTIEKTTNNFKFEKLSDYNNVVLGFDDSPSTTNDNLAIIAKIISSQKISNQKITCLVYSDKIESSQDFKKLEDATDFIKNIKHEGNSNEKALKCVYDFLKKQPDQSKGSNIDSQKENVYLYWTDENLQDVSKDLIQKIHELEKQKNFKTYGYVTSAMNKTLTEYSLDKIEKGLDKALIETASPKIMQVINQLSTKINSFEKQVGVDKENLTKTSSEELKESLKNKISKIENEIQKNKAQLEKLTNDYESGSVDRLFSNEILNNFTVGEHQKIFNKYLERTIKSDNLDGLEIQLASLR